MAEFGIPSSVEAEVTEPKEEQWWLPKNKIWIISSFGRGERKASPCTQRANYAPGRGSAESGPQEAREAR